MCDTLRRAKTSEREARPKDGRAGKFGRWPNVCFQHRQLLYCMFADRSRGEAGWERQRSVFSHRLPFPPNPRHKLGSRPFPVLCPSLPHEIHQIHQINTNNNLLHTPSSPSLFHLLLILFPFFYQFTVLDYWDRVPNYLEKRFSTS
ncbi:hypothetical protein BO99DRAFT_1912 [Aspergillus violaceofuscus CBS 115571]|uniref:Uncharacterized protein n=1 Tax=Aspergillus violaceofuscus (strain CBS 115571) TaxID=1450538 RepID=A0A2V5IWQ1_ASPV1|nr:hypothetical protein BO99DRAFT_1912 [Aspergillus violaceofuscus CBS 115571]